MFNREYTKEEELYRRLFFACLHYDGDTNTSFKKCEDLLQEVRDGNLAEDFKKHFEGLWFDQTSKKMDMHNNYAQGLKEKLRRLDMHNMLQL